MASMHEGVSGTSDEAVREATGKDWESWFLWLEEHDAQELDHPSIVRLLEDQSDLPSGWWKQQVTSSFERHIGRRVAGSMGDGTFQVGTRRTFRSSPARTWNHITTPEGAAAWLGEAPQPWWEGMHPGAPERGDILTAPSGERFEVRSSLEGTRIRLRALGPHLPPSTIQLTVSGDAGRAVVGIHQEGFQDEQQREPMREHWKRALDRIAELLAED